VRPDGSESRPLTDEPDCHHGAAAWSPFDFAQDRPDGRTLAFVRMNLTQKDARLEIWLIGVDGSSPRRLLEGGFRHYCGTGSQPGCLDNENTLW